MPHATTTDAPQGLGTPPPPTASAGPPEVVHGPVHAGVWGRSVSADDFQSRPSGPTAAVQRVMDDAVELVARHKRERKLYADDGRVREEVLQELGPTGYWGLRVPVEFGGSGADWSAFLPFLTRMATVEGAVAGALAIHSSIAGVNAINTFGDPQQRARLLPTLASGERLGVFGLTEPQAGSDLTALRTTATLDGDHYVVSGEKLFL